MNNKNGYAVHCFSRHINETYSFEEEIAEFLGHGYIVAGFTKHDNYLYALMTKKLPGIHFISKQEGKQA